MLQGTGFANQLNMQMNTELRKQKITEGVGPMYHRIYAMPFSSTLEKVKNGMKCLQCNLNDYSPQLLARFEKTKGDPQILQNDDEFLIHITGPWNGPVRVTKVTEYSFHIVTLEGHLEAGDIHFEIKQISETEFVFEIESLARSKDMLVNFVYDVVPIAKAMQTEMWKSFCENFVKEVAASVGEIQVTTERRDEDTGQWQTV